MGTIKTIKEVTERFIADGWNKNIVLTELTKEEIIKNSLNINRRYFKMENNGNIHFENGEIALFNL